MALDEKACTHECVLPISRDKAFSLVVDHFGDWWPRDYTFSGEDLKELVIEPFPGGNCYEVDNNGRMIIWGTVLSIEAPLFIRLAWQISPDRQVVPDSATASRVMISFRDAGEATRIELVHNEFIRHGEGGDRYRVAMASPMGWPKCLEALAKTAGKR